MQKKYFSFLHYDPSWQSAMGRFLSNEDDILLSGMVKSKEEALDFVKSIKVDIILLSS